MQIIRFLTDKKIVKEKRCFRDQATSFSLQRTLHRSERLICGDLPASAAPQWYLLPVQQPGPALHPAALPVLPLPAAGLAPASAAGPGLPHPVSRSEHQHSSSHFRYLLMPSIPSLLLRSVPVICDPYRPAGHPHQAKIP